MWQSCQGQTVNYLKKFMFYVKLLWIFYRIWKEGLNRKGPTKLIVRPYWNEFVLEVRFAYCYFNILFYHLSIHQYMYNHQTILK